ncbi:beta-lactamase family protein [Emcibacter nanhaiensis]|uniref:Beta-lactamase family protein n=2 Tax=Emcibacter nanhaiensis TaxID=1505037 RepID=A0A501PJS0_9PROT|nr:beta-lactamase family protein [Emcibacter nanhaiensis]
MTQYVSMIRAALILHLFIIFAHSIFSFANAAAVQEHDFSAAKRTLDDYIAKGKLAGGVILVTKDGKTVLHYAAGMQDRETGVEMKEDSLFRIASQTKALTSIAIMILHERGLIEFDDPVSKYIPSFTKTKVLTEKADGSYESVPAKREITLHDLLTHSAGIGYGWGPDKSEWAEAGLSGWYFADRNQTIQEALAPITTLPFPKQPGEAFVYGYNTDILGAIVEIVSGKSLQEFFATEITGLLNMTDTFFYVPKNKASRLAAVYGATETTIMRAPLPANAANFRESQGHYITGPRKAFSGGAGLVSTASDYGKLLNMLLGKGTLKGVTILTPESVATMTRNQIPYIDTKSYDGFGYGFRLTTSKDTDTKGQVVEFGWGGAYHSFYYVRPLDGVVVVYLTQLIPANNLNDWDEINAALREALHYE